MLLTLVTGGDIVALVREVRSDSLVVLIPATLDPVAMAQARAAIGPLAIALAPGCRLNAVCPANAADPAAVAAAIAFLEQARSTTGQLLDIA